MQSAESSPLQTKSDPAVRIGTVFIVDDEMMVTSSLETMLTLETDHRIHCFNNPLEALKALDTLRPDVIISDFSMPEMDGITFLRHVKDAMPESTLILLTGYADKESAIEAINKIGIYRYIEKPWENEELKISINNGLERAQLTNELRNTIEQLIRAQSELEATNRHLEQLVEARTRDLQQTYQKLESIIQNTADGIITLDAHLRFTSINPTARQWVEKIAPKGVNINPLEKSVQEIIQFEKGTSLSAIFSFEQTHQVQEVFIGEVPLEASIAPLNDENGFVLVLRDITQRKEVERLRDDFVSTLTHDLRTPLLAAIQTLGFFLDGTLGDLPDKQRNLIEMLVQSLREMLGLVNALLEVYKYEAGRQKLVLDTLNLPELVQTVAQELDSLAQGREQSIELALPGSIAIRGDKQELRRVLVNLIGNAIHHTPPGGKIKISAEVNGKITTVSVQDNGRGIPAKDIPLLFQRFSQGTSKKRSSGSGLGLYLSRQILEAHQGRIGVESTEGKGSRFYFELPLIPG